MFNLEGLKITEKEYTLFWKLEGVGWKFKFCHKGNKYLYWLTEVHLAFFPNF